MEDFKISAFNQAASFITPNLRRPLLSLPDDIKANAFEIRMRINKPLMLTTAGSNGFVTKSGRYTLIYNGECIGVDKISLGDTFNRMCGFSPHAYQNELINGFLTLKGGHRVGISASANMENERVTGVKDIGFLNLRIARELVGAADGLIDGVYNNGLKNVIIAGAPSSGKTTVLRDLARQLSSDRLGRYYKTTVIDERSELAAVYDGCAHNDIGLNSDIITGFPKSIAIINAIRSMSPDIIVCDEIGDVRDVEAVKAGLNSGVFFALSVHAHAYDDLIRRTQIKLLLETGYFDYIALLCSNGRPCNIKQIYNARELYYEICGNSTGGTVNNSDRA